MSVCPSTLTKCPVSQSCLARETSCLPATPFRRQRPVVLQQPSSLGQLLTWDAALGLLRDAPQLTRGTPQELAEAQQHAASCIQQARALVQADSVWNECGQVLIALDKALALVLVLLGRLGCGLRLLQNLPPLCLTW